MRTWFLFLLAAVNSLAQYAGSAACQKCHPAQSASQASSGHARALARSAPGQPGQWAFGAGLQATTFVSRLDSGDYLEHGETWYRATNSFAITPGHQNSAGLKYRVFDPSAGILRCFACHSTGKLELATDESIVPAELGVRCEVCHGPGAAHAASPKTVRLRVIATGQMNEVCGACHRVTSSAEDGSNLLDPWNSRHQPLLLAASVCFQKSKGRLACTNCHNPHQPLETRAADYNTACQKCHANPKHSQPVTGRACSDCHMPAVRLNENLAFANHRIGIYSPTDPLSPVPAR